MFKLKFLATLFIVGLATRVSSATPPACILACVNEEKSVSDIKAVCAAESAQECLADSCDSGDYSTARTYFENICKTGGYEVAKAVSATASGTAKPTASSGASSTLGTASASASADAPNASSSSAEGAGNRIIGNTPLYVGLTAMAIFVLG